MIGEEAPEYGAGADAASVIAAEGHDIGREAMEARQRVRRHAHHAVPLRLELDLTNLWKSLFDRARGPGAVDLEAREAQGADAAEQKPPARGRSGTSS